MTENSYGANKLPFADGTYVTDTALCRMSMDAIAERYKDRMGMMIYNIRGNRLDNNYESDCEIANVKSSAMAQ